MENESREVKDTSWISELRNKKWEMEETWSKNGHTELEGFMRYFYIFYFIFLSHVNFEASVQFSSVAQSCPTLCDPKNCSTPGLPVHHSRSSLKLMSIELVTPFSHLILCRPLLLLPPIPPSVTVFSNESTLHMRWPKYWSFSFSMIPSKEIPV